MQRIMISTFLKIGTMAAMLVAAVTVAVSAAEEDCLGFCDREVVLDRKLAVCFLERYEVLATKQSSAIAVDLRDCPELPQDDDMAEQDRGVVEALRMPDKEVEEPNPTFMITRTQLACLKHRLEDESLVLDPAARIALDDCE